MKTKVRKQQLGEESIEAKPLSVTSEAKNVATGVVEGLWKDLLKGSASSAPEQIFGLSGGEELQEGQEVSLAYAQEIKEETEKKVQTSAEHMEYFRTVQNVESVGETRTDMQVKQAVDQIRMEIKKLIQTSKIVERTVKDATSEKAPIKPGKYHITFFEFVLSMLRDATRKLEDTANYGAVFTSKKQQSKYWNRYKSHGTSFGLSGERTVSTQTG